MIDHEPTWKLLQLAHSLHDVEVGENRLVHFLHRFLFASLCVGHVVHFSVDIFEVVLSGVSFLHKVSVFLFHTDGAVLLHHLSDVGFGRVAALLSLNA